MNISIANNYDGNFTVTVEGAGRKDVLAIRAVTDQIQLLAGLVRFEENLYADPANWSRELQQAFIEAARLHFQLYKNKILTIKFIRALCEPTLGLKDAKDLADYAIHGPDACPLVTWIKR